MIIMRHDELILIIIVFLRELPPCFPLASRLGLVLDDVLSRSFLESYHFICELLGADVDDDWDV